MHQPSLTAEKILTDGELRAIGAIAVEWSYMEIILQITIWRLLNIGLHPGMVVTGDMTSGQLLSLLRPLARDVCEKEPIYLKLEKLLGDIDHLQSERNKAVHLVYADINSNRIGFRIKRTPELQRHPRLSEEQLLKIAHQIREARIALRKMKLPTTLPMSARL